MESRECASTMFDIALNTDLLNIVKDKRVALIGPAPYLTGKGSGTYFDNYDVICRPNDIIPPENLRADYGNKTDIMFHNLGDHVLPILRKKIEEDKEHFKKLRMVCCLATKAKHSDTNFLSWPDNYVSDVVQNFDQINEYNIPFYWIGNRDYRKIYNEIGTEPNQGVLSIAVLMSYPIKELLVSGFTFYLHCKTYEDTYRDSYHTECNRIVQDFKKGRAFGFDAGHGSVSNRKQIDFFKKKCSKKITIDSHLKDLLDIDHNRVYQL